jgi:hypothetical protein
MMADLGLLMRSVDDGPIVAQGLARVQRHGGLLGAEWFKQGGELGKDQATIDDDSLTDNVCCQG